MDRDDPFIGRANGLDRTSGACVGPDISAARGAIARGATTGSAASFEPPGVHAVAGTLPTKRDVSQAQQPKNGRPGWTPALDGLYAGALLDRLNRGVVVLDMNSVPVFMNRAGAAIVDRRGAFAVSAGRLALLDRRARQVWVAFMKELARATEHAAGSVVLRVERTNFAPPYRILAARLDGRAPSSGSPSALVVVFIYEPRRDCSIRLPVLMDLYGLTLAEARLTANLFQGRSVTDAAGHLGITVNTARCHLKRVFAKCEVQSQAELLQLLALGPQTC